MNVTPSYKDGIITLAFDPTAKPYKKTQGGHDMIAGYQGTMLVPGVGTVRIGLNVYKTA